MVVVQSGNGSQYFLQKLKVTRGSVLSKDLKSIPDIDNGGCHAGIPTVAVSQGNIIQSLIANNLTLLQDKAVSFPFS